jgi:hypothetical protein
LLNAGSDLGGEDQLRRAVLERTLRLLGRRQRVRRLGLGAALVGCYLAGITTVAVWSWTSQAAPQSIARQDSPRVEQPIQRVPPKGRIARGGKSDSRGQRRPEPDNLHTARAPLSQFQLLKRQGDYYLESQADVQLASKYYGRALDAAAPEERAVSVEDDSWLLMVLKEDRLKETSHANGDG